MKISHSPLHITSRALAAILGGYGFTWGFISLTGVAFAAAGMEFHDAWSLAFMVGLLLFVATFCWCFATRPLSRVWSVMGGGGLLMTALGWVISRPMV